jgi:hypothetical protein
MARKNLASINVRSELRRFGSARTDDMFFIALWRARTGAQDRALVRGIARG